MNASFYIDHDSKVVLISLSGSIRLSQIYEVIRFLWTLEGYDPSYDQIVDGRNSRMHMSITEMSDLESFMRDSEKGLKAKAALVISAPGDAALSEIYGHASRENHATEIFTSPQEAIKFTGASNNIYDGLESDEAVSKEF
jgi:hypothetical protein